jgi:formate C-acetyltransferase
LKVTELLKIRDPNVNARYDPEKNTDAYLRRLCEVNRITTATPSLHNDAAIAKALAQHGYPIEDARDWSATGCVEPTLSGKHMGHTGGNMISLVAALEMALYNGRHPLMAWDVGPKTGRIEDGAFESFEAFYDAFATQLGFLVDQAAEYNYVLGEAHATIRPTPFLSALLDGPLKKGVDVTRGGSTYNTAGVACIGLADVTDSLMTIKKLVFDEKRVSFADLKTAVDDNFAGHEALHAMVRRRVPQFGSGDSEARAMAMRVQKLIHDLYRRHKNFRGGTYVTGFWSMSNHVAFGTLAGALPSGRLAGKAFTPGLTPEPTASVNLLDNLRDVAALDPASMDNNMAFNVKIVPGADDSHADVVDRMCAYVRGYFDLGGMQMQMNVVSSDTLRDAMAHPEAYRDLLVRISGYNAYFVTLNRDMQVELIERAEFGLS